MSELITKLNPALVAEAMRVPSIIYTHPFEIQLHPEDYKTHTYDDTTQIGVIILTNSTIHTQMFWGSDLSSAQLMNVTSIESSAFYNCESLTSISIPNSVTSIGESAFYGCKSLTSISIPNSVTSIGESAFSNCHSLTSVIIPDSVTSIRDFVFWECTSLTNVVIPDSVTSIGECAFFECGLTSVTIPKHVTYISDGAFNTCSQLSTIYCKASTPPDTIEDAGCLPYNSNLKIYIPVNSLESYKNHEYWQYRVDALIETVFEDEVLESGTNIKTINGNSILGSGDIAIESDGNVYTWSVPTDVITGTVITGTVTPEEYAAIKEASQVYIEMEGVYYQALKMNADKYGSLILSAPIILNDSTGTHTATGLCFEIISDLTFSGSVFMVNIPTKTSQLTNDANFVTYANFEWDGSSEGIVTQEKFEELRNADIVIVKQQDMDMIAHTSKTSGGAVIFYYSATINNVIESAMFIVMDQDYSWTYSTSQTTIPAAVTEATVSGWGFTKNAGTVTGVKINGNTQNPSNGVVDLGTVITEHQPLKTINGESIIGSGDITIEGGSSGIYVWEVATDSDSGTITPETYDALYNAPKIVLKQDNGAEIEMIKMIHEGTILLCTLQTTMAESSDVNYMYIVSMYYYINPDYTYSKTGGMCVIPTGVNLYSKPSNGIPKSDLASDVQTSLNKADTALQSYTEQYKGTVTSVKVNGVTKNQSSGVVDLGYVNKQLSTTTSSSMTLSPNIYYRNTSTSLSSLTIKLGSVSNSNILNEYFVEFTTRSSGTTISLPSSIKWANGVTPTFENGKTYQISIVNNLGTCVKFG